MRQFLESLLNGKRVQLNIQEIHQPELDAYLVGRSIAEQIERRIAYRRAMKQAIFRTIQAGAKGIRIRMAGRLAGAEIARRQLMHEGRVPLHTLRADIDYGFTEAHTIMGRIGIKIWIYKGDVLPERKTEEGEAAAEGTAPAVAVTPTPSAAGAPTAIPAVVASAATAPAVTANAATEATPADSVVAPTGKEV